MPTVYAVISFFSYRYFRSYTYYSLIYVGEDSFLVLEPGAHHAGLVYEAVTISAFLCVCHNFSVFDLTEIPAASW
jgi:hypothetical protein